MNEENEKRSERAYNALLVNRQGADESGVTDLITDLMHYCDDSEIDFNRSLAMALMHYNDERNN